jgi:hypothetical protein
LSEVAQTAFQEVCGQLGQELDYPKKVFKANTSKAPKPKETDYELAHQDLERALNDPDYER